MDKRTDLANSKSLVVCGSHENTDDEFEEYTEEEILSDEGKNEEGSSDEELAEVPCEEELDDEDSEHEEESEEDSEEDVSVEEIVEEDISEDSEEEPNGKEPSRGSMDQPPLVNDSDVPSLLEQKKALDVTQASSRRRRSGWDIKAEDVKVVNGSDVCKTRKTRWSSDVKAEASMPVNASTDVNKRRKTRWSSDEAQSGIIMLPDSLKCDQHLQKLHAKLQLLNQKLEGHLIVNLDSSSLEESGKKKKPKLSPKRNFMFSKKIHIPSKEYPGYNFIGLILGPRGNSLRKMEEETGATIRLRGKGSYLKKNCPHNDDELHVLVEADSQFSVDAATNLVEKLLVPVEDGRNYHKAAQLRELAEIRGTLVDGKPLLGVKQVGPCDVCGMSNHSTSGCPLMATELQMDAKVIAETYGNKDNPDPTRVYVGRLPYSLSSDKLKELFLPYGSLCEATVMLDKSTGISKGYGIVKYMTSNDAANAIEIMNGYRINGKQLIVRMAGTSPSSDENPPNNPGPASNHPIPTANLSSSPGFAATPSSNANLPNYPGLGATPSYSNLNLPSYPGFSSVPSSSAILPSYSGLAAAPSSLSANLPTFPGLAATPTSSMSNPASFPGFASMHPSSSNADLPSYPKPISLPPSSVNASLPINPGSATFLPPDTKLPNYPGHVDISPSNLTAKLPIYSGSDVFSLPSSNAKLPNYPGYAVIPSSSGTNLPSYPGVTATPSSSNLNLPSVSRPATFPQSSMNANFPSYPNPATLPPYSNAKMPSYPGFASIVPPSNANLPSDTIFDAFPRKISEQSAWPGPPGSTLPESEISFFKSTYKSLAQAGGVPSQSSTSLSKNMSALDGKKLEHTVTGTPPLSLIPNLPNYAGFAAIPRTISEPRSVTAVPSELASFPGYLKSIDTYRLDQSMPSSGLSSQQPHFTRKFPVNQINPTLRNYNHPSSK